MLYDPGETTSFRASDGNMVKIEYYKELPSTSDLAKNYAEAGKPDRYVVFAEKQFCSSITGSKESLSEILVLYLSYLSFNHCQSTGKSF